MNKRINAWLAILAMLIMICVSIGIGAYKGWKSEYRSVESTLFSLTEMLTARKEVGYNILTVAKRHVSKSDPLVQKIEKNLAVLMSESSLSEKAIANAEFTSNAQAMLKELLSLSTVSADERDLMYVNSLLPQALEQSARHTDEALYNNMANRFNQSLNRYFSGKLAQRLGIRKAEQFVVPQPEMKQ